MLSGNIMDIVQKVASPLDTDWESNSYFMSSSETSFELGMLQKFEAELFLGQVS